MSGRLTPPILPLRPADSSSKFLAKNLALAYPLLDGNNVLKNYGSWGTSGDLTISGATYSRVGGLSTLTFGSGAVASRTSIGMTIPEEWSFVYWVKVNAVPTTEELSIFTLQGPAEAHLRAWGSSQGIWAWQKFSTADSYSILPAADFPTSNLMMVAAVFSGSQLPPAQLRTNQGLTSNPLQPLAYTAYNQGVGTQATTVNAIYLGNNAAGTAPLNGSLGPLYFWNRTISDSEVWQLWKDPYAPFRRSLEQNVVPSAMVSFGSNSLEGIGKSTDLKSIFQDGDIVILNVQDYAPYVTVPSDSVSSEEIPFTSITVNDTYTYAAFPTDSIEGDAPFTLVTITVNDNMSYVTFPTDSFIDGESGSTPVTIITVTDNLSYVALPSDTYDGPGSGSTTSDVITINENYAYQNIPTDTVTSP